MNEDFKCQAKAPTSGDAVSRDGALHPSVGEEICDMLKAWQEWICSVDDRTPPPLSPVEYGYVNIADAISSLLADNARLREALKPFAKAGEIFSGTNLDSMTIYAPAAGEQYYLESDDLCRARAALASAPRPDEEERSDDTASKLAGQEHDTP